MARGAFGGVRQALDRRRTQAVAVAASDEHDDLRLGEIDGVFRRADGVGEAALFREVAGRTMRIDVVRPERMDEHLRVGLARRARILHDRDRFCAVLGGDGLDALPDGRKRIVPGNRFERAVLQTMQRLGDTLFGIRELRDAMAAPAQHALGIRMILVTLERPELAIDDIGPQAALARAPVAHRRRGYDLAAPSLFSRVRAPRRDRRESRRSECRSRSRSA